MFWLIFSKIEIFYISEASYSTSLRSSEFGGFDESHWLIEDVDLNLRVAMAGGVYLKAPSAFPIFWYRDRPRSLSKSSQAEFVEGCVRNAKLVEQYARKVPDSSAKTIEAVLNVYLQGARYFAEHDLERFERILADIEALQPGFVPDGPFRLRALSRMIGYRNAERASVFYRKLKRHWRAPHFDQCTS